MSGGVDSSVAAYLLKKQGYEVVGIYIRCYNIDGCAERDAEDARRVAEHIGIPFYVWDFEKEYRRDVVKYMIEGYRKGITPNPDVMCNRRIKFGLFLKKAIAAGADCVATGHYVRVERGTWNVEHRKNVKIARPSSEFYVLSSAKDSNKDQSYFLWTLTQDQLKYCLFPIGNYIKPKVRAIARRAGLPTAGKKDSQGVCFLGKFSVADFLKQHIKPKMGAVVTTSGEKIGEHDGAYFYTIGQRHGLALGTKNLELRTRGSGETKPHYVASKDSRTNTIVVAESIENPALHKKEIILRDVNFICEARGAKYEVLARVRYRQPLCKAKLCKFVTRNLKSETWKLIFDKPQKFVAEGQSAVFYSTQSEMLGGGVIQSST